MFAIAVWDLLDEGSVMVRQMRAFGVASEMGRGGVSVVTPALTLNRLHTK